MKKFITSIVAVIYLFTSTGAVMHFHYCMGKLTEWGFGSKESKVCPGCGMSKKDTDEKGCCKDENKYLKNASDQKIAEFAFTHLQAMAALLPVSYNEFAQIELPAITIESRKGHDPPLRHSISIYILNCNYRI